ncbi:MAG: Mrp/NBP35 family ATP-binding protein [Ignavibacteria bacterium]|nr:Mrp/NBP35 family ATP-binding protein [Ignavibacteria bacterium]
MTDNKIPGVKYTVAVVSGKGGVGKSTVAVNLTAALKMKGFKVGLVDADIYGPSIPIMLGVSERPAVTKHNDKNLLIPVEKYGIKLMSIGFLLEKKDSAVIWRGPMASSALRQFVYDVLWGELDYLIFDMPPGTGDIQLTLGQTIPLNGAVLITTPQEIALADAEKGHLMFQKVNVPTVGIIENMSYYLKDNGVKEYIFGEEGGKKLCDKYQLPLLGRIPIDKTLRESGDAGYPLVLQRPESPLSKEFITIANNTVAELGKIDSGKKQDLEIII